MIAASDVKQTSKTVMFAERKNDSLASSARQWDWAAPDNTTSSNGYTPPGRVENQWGFSWPDTITPNLSTNPSYDPNTATSGLPVSAPLYAYRTDQGTSATPLNANLMHPGIIIMTFCDGHVDSVSTETGCKTLLAVPDLQNLQ